MEKQHFSILINADKRKVWDTMLDKKTYTAWTKAFHEGSYYEGSWDKGQELRFLGKEEDGSVSGMFSKVKENIPYEFVSIEHLGIIHKGIVDTTSEDVKKWAPAFEDYSFAEKGNQTEVRVDVDVNEEYEEMFKDMWPKALNDLKALCEQ